VTPPVRRIRTPLNEPDVLQLRSGQRVLLSGTVYTARDAAHQRMAERIAADQPLPFGLAGQVLFYAGPAPAAPGRVIGSVGPTSSYRMDPYTIPLLERGLRGMIGKGNRSAPVMEALKRYGAVYFAATGGAAALTARTVKQCVPIAFEDLGPEAVYRLEVEDLPLVVVNDCHGGDLYREGVERFRVQGSGFKVQS
jgi:fumarate hydratase subunit beta